MDISDYTLESVTIVGRGSLGNDGEWDYSGGSTVTTARVMNKVKQMHTPQGVETIYDRVFWMKPGETINVDDRITYDSTNHHVVDVRKLRDIASVVTHHKVMTLISGVASG